MSLTWREYRRRWRIVLWAVWTSLKPKRGQWVFALNRGPVKHVRIALMIGRHYHYLLFRQPGVRGGA